MGSRIATEERPYLLVDRDGVLVKDVHYLKNKDDIQIVDGVYDLLKSARNKGYGIVVITNQSGIGRGYLDWDKYREITEKILTMLGGKDLVDAIYTNCIVSDNRNDSWRKPGTGMIERASLDYNIDKNRSVVIGDRLSDIKSGIRAGINKSVLFVSQWGKQEELECRTWLRSESLGRSRVLIANSMSDILQEL